MSSSSAKPATTGSGFNYATLVPAITTLLGTAGALEDQRRENEATLRNIESAGKSARFSQFQMSQQLEDINRVASDALSASGLEAMQREATLKAASAETGSTSNQEAIQTAFIQENFRNAQIVRDADTQMANTKMGMVANRLGLENELESMRYNMKSPLGQMLNTLNTGMQGFNTGLGMLSTSDRNEVLGVDTTGKAKK